MWIICRSFTCLWSTLLYSFIVVYTIWIRILVRAWCHWSCSVRPGWFLPDLFNCYGLLCQQCGWAIRLVIGPSPVMPVRPTDLLSWGCAFWLASLSRPKRCSGADYCLTLSRTMRAFCRCQSRSFWLSRLSCCFLPWASSMRALTKCPFQ